MNHHEEKDKSPALKVLLIGSGVIGSVYGCHLSLACHSVWVLAHGEREKEINQNGIRLYNIDSNKNETAKVMLAKNVLEKEYELVIVAVKANQLRFYFYDNTKIKRESIPPTMTISAVKPFLNSGLNSLLLLLSTPALDMQVNIAYSISNYKLNPCDEKFNAKTNFEEITLIFERYNAGFYSTKVSAMPFLPARPVLPIL